MIESSFDVLEVKITEAVIAYREGDCTAQDVLSKLYDRVKKLEQTVDKLAFENEKLKKKQIELENRGERSDSSELLQLRIKSLQLLR